LRVAIVHYWLVGMRGGEKVLEALCDLFPDAVIVTHVADRNQLSAKLRHHEIRETMIARLPGARRHYKKYLPLMPFALEAVDLSEFDLVISSESGPAKGVICRPDAVHLCYCHTPMRYIWDQYHLYRSVSGVVPRILMPWLAHKMRIWDVTTAARVDKFVANSNFVSKRILSFYRREATVIHPPVAVEEFSVLPPDEIGDHYLLAGELVHYKRADLAVRVFTELGLPLRIVGDGEQRRALEQIAGPSISFLGRLTFQELKYELASCRALIFPGEEDFGIIPVEAMASGRPVIAFGRGGVLDSIKPDVTGMFFREQTTKSLAEAVAQFEQRRRHEFQSSLIRDHALQFSAFHFKEAIQRLIDRSIEEKLNGKLLSP
jgi:glycosyltransferase involved in cell wall biosynthesis